MDSRTFKISHYFHLMIRLLHARTLLIGAFLGMLSSDMHPLHMSSATLIQTEKNSWVIQKTLFTDDLEESLVRLGFGPIRLSEIASHQSKLEAYLHENLQLYRGHSGTDGRPIPWTLDAPYLYSPESIRIMIRFEAKAPFTLFDFSLLQDFPDQKNVYAVRKGGEGWSQHGLLDADHTSMYIP